MTGSTWTHATELAPVRASALAARDFVRLRGDGLCLLLTLRDSSAEVAFERPPGSTSTGGRGLAIVDQLSHDWGVDHADGVVKSVWASFRTP